MNARLCQVFAFSLLLTTPALSQGITVTPKPCAAGATEIGGLCVAPLSAPIPPQPVGCQGVNVAAGASIQSAVDANAAGATLCLAGSLYRVAAPVNPKQGQIIQGTTGTIVSGAKVLTGWAKNGTDYVANGFLPPTPAADPDNGGRCDVQNCTWREDVFIDGAPLKRVAARTALATGKYFPDYPNNKIYVRDNPSGRLLEQSSASAVFKGTNQGVTLKTMTVQMSANAEQAGMIDCQGGSGWLIDGVDIKFAHGVGIECDSFTMRNSHIHHNGQLGMGGHGNNILVEDSEIDNNNTAGYNDGWEGGGSKFSQGCCGAENGILRRNKVHDNLGAGLWCDINCYKWTFEGNTAYHNRGAGIFYEISHTCWIKGNTTYDNAWEFTTPNGFYNQADILISASPNCEVSGNTVKNFVGIGGLQQDRNGGCTVNGNPNASDGTPWCESNQHILRNLKVHDNDVTAYATETLVAGISRDWGANDIFTSKGNLFSANTYHGLQGYPFTWNNMLMNEATWNASGQH